MILEQTGELAPANEPWRLIRDAISDLELQEKCPLVVIHMLPRWHYYVRASGKCHQCLAGVSMSRRLGTRLEHNYHICEFEPSIYCRLMALDYFRQGYIALALNKLGLDLPSGIPETVPISEYSTDLELFKRDMLALAGTLERAFCLEIEECGDPSGKQHD